MPTHQGKTQTDIVIGDGGDSIELESSIEFAATYGTSANFQYKINNTATSDSEDSSYELKVLDASGATLATFFAKYTCDPVTGTATDVDSTRTNTFSPSPNGSSPAAIPSSRETYASRSWSISAMKNNQSFAGFQASWQFASTVPTGGSVSQTVSTQNNDELEVTLTYTSGGNTVLSVVVTCSTAVSASSAMVWFNSPSVSDTLQP